MEHPHSQACAAAIAYGIDLNLLEDILLESVEQRIDDHERALGMVNELQKGFIRSKSVVGRPKDKAAVIELNVIKEKTKN